MSHVAEVVINENSQLYANQTPIRGGNYLFKENNFPSTPTSPPKSNPFGHRNFHNSNHHQHEVQLNTPQKPIAENSAISTPNNLHNNETQQDEEQQQLLVQKNNAAQQGNKKQRGDKIDLKLYKPSIYLLVLIALFDSMTFAIVIPSLWPYLHSMRA